MKLNEMNAEIVAACGMAPRSVQMVQKETFRRLRQAIASGERVLIPGFGSFSTKEKPAEGDTATTKVIRFKMQEPDEQSPDEDRKAKKLAKKLKKAAASEEEGDETGDAAETPLPDEQKQHSAD